jgi:8-oxo-dGTP pyrophosphatase MutT (NUDIX family)
MSESRLLIRQAVSAGGVVFRRREDTVEVVLCGRREPAMWGLPKGTPNEGETLEEAASREVREETGVEVRLGKKIGTIDYWFVRAAEGARYHKTVHYFLMQPLGGDVGLHDHEFDEVAWIPVGEAHKLLTYKNEAEVVAKALDMIHNQSSGDEEETPQ